jgi:hypothetical protein
MGGFDGQDQVVVECEGAAAEVYVTACRKNKG